MLGMGKKLSVVLVCLLAGIGLVSGCKKKTPPSVSAHSDGYFKTPFQTESEFVVGAIASDLAEQMFFAAHHQLPDKKDFSVAATENGGSIDEPIFHLDIRMGAKHDLNTDLKIGGPIWSPGVYQALTKQLADAVGLNAGTPNAVQDTGVISKLLDATPETIERQNRELSDALEGDFADPELHEKAALLLAAFAFREHSGYFYEIRSPLSCLTAHLAMAQFLRGGGPAGINGQMADALMLTMAGDQELAIERLNAMDTNDVAVAAMVRGLRARNTGDYRPLANLSDRSPFESIQWFHSFADYVDTDMAWAKLTDEQKRTIDYVRIANDLGYSVEIGHDLLAASVPLETREIKSIYELSHPGHSLPQDPAAVLNVIPEHCVSSDADGKAHVQVIGWGQWAMFFQRQLCHAIQQNFYMMNHMWGVPDDAKEFASRCQQAFGRLTLYPFVERFNCTDIDSYHKSVDEGFKLTVDMPQFVPAYCWNYLCYSVSFAPRYDPNPNPHVNEWHNHNPLPGTVYDLNPRFDHPSLVNRGDVLERMEALHELAPYDCRMANYIAKHKYNDNLTPGQAMALYHAVLPYSLTGLRAMASSQNGDPKQYEQLMTQAAQLEPSCYYRLGDYVWRMNNTLNEDKAAAYYQKGYNADRDRVRAASYATWLVRYLLKHGQRDKAADIAKEGGEVYSEYGLTAQATFFEETSNYDSAFEWYQKIEERYNDSAPLVNFCYRYKAKTGDRRFQAEVEKREGKLFPKGKESVSINDFKGPPVDGVTLDGDSPLMTAAGLKNRDIIVAAYGVRVHNMAQYNYIRDSNETPELDLIVWHGGGYIESKSSPPNHLFGVAIHDYYSNR